MNKKVKRELKRLDRLYVDVYRENATLWAANNNLGEDVRQLEVRILTLEKQFAEHERTVQWHMTAAEKLALGTRP